jgi:hypothetical protein
MFYLQVFCHNLPGGTDKNHEISIPKCSVTCAFNLFASYLVRFHTLHMEKCTYESPSYLIFHISTCSTVATQLSREETRVASQRLGNHVPAEIISELLLRNESVNTSTTMGCCWKECFLFSPCKVVINNSSVEKR